jgi:hypothetical protein
MILFRSCPTCSTGDLIKTSDTFGEYMECVQCGYVKDVEAANAPVGAMGVLIPFPVFEDDDDDPLRSA